MMGKIDYLLRRGDAPCPDAKIAKKARYLGEERDQSYDAIEAFFASLVSEGTQEPNHGAGTPDCWQRWTRAPYYDRYEWRKYGEKYISSIGSKRCYYRCTHKSCPAKKRVENRSSGDPTLYLVTYEKEHTCNSAPILSQHQFSLDPLPTAAAPFSLSFYSQHCQMDQQQQQFQSTLSGHTTAGTPESHSSSSFLTSTTPCTMTPAGSMEMESYDLEDVDLGDLDVLQWLD